MWRREQRNLHRLRVRNRMAHLRSPDPDAQKVNMLIIIKGSEVRDGEPRRYADDYNDALATLDRVAAGVADLQAWATADSPFAVVDRLVVCRRCSAAMRRRNPDRDPDRITLGPRDVEWLVCNCPGREVHQSFIALTTPEVVAAMFVLDDGPAENAP